MLNPATISANAADNSSSARTPPAELGTDKARGYEHNQANPEEDEGEPLVTAKRPRQPFAFAIVSTNRLNFSMTKPNAITAMPVRSQARKVRSLAE